MRPFYFMVCVWGERFSNYMLDYCIPSLLSPNNVPALPSGPHKMLVACPSSDWERIRTKPIVAALSRHLELVHLEIPFPEPGVMSTLHMGVGHRLATALCFRDKALGVALTPDLMLSDGTVANLVQKARAGVHAVLCVALRFAEEPLFEALRAESHDVPDRPRRDGGEALSLSGRDMVRIGIPAFHSQTRSYYFDSPDMGEIPAAAIWDVRDSGVLIHSLSWAPLLMDYSRLEVHDTAALETWTMDGDYVHANFGNRDTVYACRDSDEMMLVSWAPEAYQSISPTESWLRRHIPVYRRWLNGMLVHESVCSPRCDDLKRRLFRLPVKWHLGPIDDRWKRVEATAARAIARRPRWYDRAYPLSFEIRLKVRNLVDVLRWNAARMRLFAQALTGNREARKLISESVRRRFSG